METRRNSSWLLTPTDRSDLRGFYTKIHGRADELVTLLEELPSREAPELVTQILANPRLAPYFGGRTGYSPGGDDGFSRWLMHLWGRRCANYLSVFASALKTLNEVDGETSINLRRVEKIDREASVLKACYTRRYKSIDKSLRDRKDIANHHVTYIDPILFSSLLLLRRDEEEHLLDDEQRQVLHVLVRDEFERSTDTGSKWSATVGDESTIWWALKTLVETLGDEFKMGSHRGYKGAAQVFGKLLKGGDVRFPNEEMALAEATFEIHGAIRTRLLNVKNWVELLRVIPGEYLEDIYPVLRVRLRESLNIVMSSELLHDHIYFLGISLELMIELLRDSLSDGKTYLATTIREFCESDPKFHKEFHDYFPGGPESLFAPVGDGGDVRVLKALGDWCERASANLKPVAGLADVVAKILKPFSMFNGP